MFRAAAGITLRIWKGNDAPRLSGPAQPPRAEGQIHQQDGRHDRWAQQRNRGWRAARVGRQTSSELLPGIGGQREGSAWPLNLRVRYNITVPIAANDNMVSHDLIDT